MPYDPISSQTSYIQPSDLFARMDINLIGQLCSDTALPVASADLITHPYLLAALSDASGMFESAAFESERYSADDLQALDGVSKQYMLRILSQIAAFNLWTRRDAPNPPATVIENYNNAIEVLEKLRTGQSVLSFHEIAEAGLPLTQQFQLSDYYNNNWLTTRWRRMFGSRQKDRRGQSQ